MKKLQGKVSIVTGAGAGMGKAIALLFAAQGSKVVATDINQERLKILQEEADEQGRELTTLVANVANEQDVEAMMQLAVSKYGRLDVLVNNAGVMDNFAPVGELDNSTWERVMAINVDGTFKAMRSAIRIFLENGGGTIVNLTSMAGLGGGKAGAAYTASKHAVVGLTKNAGFTYAKSGIRCNAIAPGSVETSIGETIDYTKISAIANETIMPGMVTSPRAGQPDELAQVALFLASDDASFINGQVLAVDGGWSAY